MSKTMGAAILVALLCGATLRADIVVGKPDLGSGNCFPFGCNTGNRYQQVYAASDFSGPITLEDLEFFHTQFPGGSVLNGNYTISLSTTNAQVNNLDTTNFANNVGPDSQIFFSGTLGGETGTLDIIGIAFTYDPSEGNLLVDISAAYTGGGGMIFFDAMNGDANGLFSRAQNYGGGFAGYGLVTGFSTVPEPGTLSLLGIGLAVLGLVKTRRRKFGV